MSEKFEKFSVIGETDEFLKQVLEANKNFIDDLDYINAFFVDKRGTLLFCHLYESEMNDDTYKLYPFDTNIDILVAHASSHLRKVSDKELEKLGQLPTGYEEDYIYGWHLFIPECTYYEKATEKPGEFRFAVSDYEPYTTILAIHPYLIEIGK